MGDVIEFGGIAQTEYGDDDDAVIQIERTEEFVEIAKELSALISSLPLNREQNDQLIDMIIKQVNSAEEAAFKQGFGLGLRYVEYGEEHPNET